MNRVAIIDLGSNTARLVLMAYEPGRSYRLLDELREVVRLSEGMSGAGGVIRPEAFERGIHTLRAFRAYCDASGAQQVRATATSAVRDAANRDAFLAAARERAGLELELLSGEAEAGCGALAVANSLAVVDGFVLDIGGGSVQLSRLRGRRFTAGTSWPLGAVRLSERFLRSDPPKKKEVKALLGHLRETVGGGLAGFGDGLPLVGMGGTLRNLADMQQRREGYPIDLLHGYLLRQEALAAITDDLVTSSVAAKRSLPGLNADRADIITAGALTANAFLELSGAPGILISGQGMREGLFYPYLLAGRPEPLLDDVRRFSVENLARQYYDFEAHNRHVQTLALALFDGLAPLHGYGAVERELLAAAALVHDIGMAVNYYDHHRHGFYLAMSAALPGFSHREQAIIALLVRYHRKGKPDPQTLGGLLEEGDMTRVARLAALLRLAEYLERSKAQLVRGVRCRVSEGELRIEAVAEAEVQVEVQEANAHSDLLASAYGVKVEVVLGKPG